MFSPRSSAFLLSLAVALAPLSARSTPPSRAELALVHDLQVLVQAQQSTDWKIDRYEYEEMIPDALESLCATTETTRQQVRITLDARVRALGGPVEAAFIRRGRDVSEIADLRFATRVLTLLDEAMKRAPAECPFWIPASVGFRGKQTDAYRFTLSAEGGGLVVVYRPAGGHTSGGGGGSGRLLLGRGLDFDWSLLGGIELGGAALFDRNGNGDFPILLTAATPVLLRFHELTWHYDVELAPVALFTSDDARPTWGGRVGALLALSTPRFRRIMPWAGLGLAAEYVFGSDVRPAARILQGGLRIGFDWDFSGKTPTAERVPMRLLPRRALL